MVLKEEVDRVKSGILFEFKNNILIFVIII